MNDKWQGLVEYELVLALLALAAAAAMNSIAQKINQTFIDIGTNLSTSTS